MTDYKLEIKQIVDYPKCRIYRKFIQSLISDRSIRTNGRSGLFSLCGALLLREFPHILPALRRHQLHRASRSVDLPAAGAADVVPRAYKPSAFAPA